MKKHLFIADKYIYKANMHCHTTLSDGRRTPEEIKALYKAKGYSIAAFTDHDILKAHAYLNDAEFLAINGCEVAINQPKPEGGSWDRTSTYHFNLYATRADMADTPPLPDMDYADTEAINQYIAERTREGYLVCYNHPYWSLQTHAEYSKLKGCFAMEIYNHNCEVAEGYYGYNPQVYDEMLRAAGKLYCFSTDDNHNASPEDSASYDSFGGFLRINSESLNYESIMKSLINGDFYASQGPEIHEISLENGIISVKCSPCQTIVVYTQGRKCYVKTGSELTEAQFKLCGDEGYVRVMVRNSDGKDANSNAYWLT